MIDKLTIIITNRMIDRKIIEIDKRNIYEYGLNLMISGVVSALLVIIIGIITKEVLYALIYNAIMISLRMYTGGYHASTHAKCNLYFCGLFVFSIVILNCFNYKWFRVCIWILTFVSEIIIAQFSPIENKNKKIDSTDKVRYLQISKILSTIILIVAMIFYFVNLKIHIYICEIIVIIAILMLAELIKK